jgi:hypothetical protein
MDSATLAWTLVVFFAGALLTFFGLVLTGQLVPGSKLDKALAAADHFERAFTTLDIVVKRFDMVADMTGAVLRATETKAASTPASSTAISGGERA